MPPSTSPSLSLATLLPTPLPVLLQLPSHLSAGNKEGDGKGGKSNGNGNAEGNGNIGNSNGDGNKEGKGRVRAARKMGTAAKVAGNEEGDGKSSK